MPVTEQRSVNGGVYGSAPLVYVVMLLGVWAVLAIAGTWNVCMPITTAFAITVLLWMLRLWVTPFRGT